MSIFETTTMDYSHLALMLDLDYLLVRISRNAFWSLAQDQPRTLTPCPRPEQCPSLRSLLFSALLGRSFPEIHGHLKTRVFISALRIESYIFRLAIQDTLVAPKLHCNMSQSFEDLSPKIFSLMICRDRNVFDEAGKT